ncbi:hypothetical protein [Pseudomonas sp. S32]|uniref:hypothetical protein n=1 Tax=Pseudomonas sp. S32 TaxID=2767448 RepID=UPI001912EF12|nr:hypothetical protein [Pseudomonas sp. S32]MBK5003966.1 hypothetical protein [Pseudomonas sp. S32]
MRPHIKSAIEMAKSRSRFALTQAQKQGDDMLIIVKGLTDAIDGLTEALLVLDSHLADVERNQ